MLRCSFFVHDLEANPIVRAAYLARALSAFCEVEVLGLLLGQGEVYEPYRELFPFKVERCDLDVRSSLPALARLAGRAEGQLVYACKPLFTTFGPGLLAARGFARKTLWLDVEDDETTPMGKTPLAFVWRDVVKGWRHPTAWKYTRLLQPLTRLADAITVASRPLQQRYGGVLLRHGPDETRFDPGRPELADRAACRARFGLPPRRRLALFAGTPQPHKGWKTLLAALLEPSAASWDLVLAGKPDHAEFVEARALLGERCHVLGLVSQAQMPVLLAAVDAVPIPQDASRFAHSQIPAKLLEALAMETPVVASAVGDLEEILDRGGRGLLVAPGDAAALARALARVADDPEAARGRGRAGRQWFLGEASLATARARLEPLLARAGRA